VKGESSRVDRFAAYIHEDQGIYGLTRRRHGRNAISKVESFRGGNNLSWASNKKKRIGFVRLRLKQTEREIQRRCLEALWLVAPLSVFSISYSYPSQQLSEHEPEHYSYLSPISF
jgi:hypothetical protein